MRLALKSLSDLLHSPQATATALLTGLVDLHGTEMLDWDPDTLRAEVADDFGVVPPQVSLDKVNALCVVMTTDMFHRDLDAFLHVCRAIGDMEEASFDAYEPVGAAGVARAIAETALLDPDGGKQPQFADEIRDYVSHVLQHEGIVRPPRILAKLAEAPDPDGLRARLDLDGSDFEAWWDSQDQRRRVLDGEVRTHLANIISQVAALPLTSAKPGFAADLLARAQAAGLTSPAATA